MANTRTNASNPLEIRSPRLVHERVLATSVGQLSQSVPSGVLRKHGTVTSNSRLITASVYYNFLYKVHFSFCRKLKFSFEKKQ